MSAIKPIQNDHPRDWHQEHFAEFVAAKAAIGEPTPHMRVVQYLANGLPPLEARWLAGCYLAGYSVLTGEAVAAAWPWERVRAEPEGLLPWLRENWAGVHTRRPRRAVRTPEKFARCLLSYADWSAEAVPGLGWARSLAPDEEYDAWWASANSIAFFGRYISIRLLELFRRWEYLGAGLYDIRAVGAHSPIRCLMLLEPDRVPELSTGERDAVDAVAERVKAEISEDTSYFIFATLLCEYRAAYEDGGDYAGNQHDEELEYSLSRYADYWRDRGFQSRLYEARASIDPHECLGEIQGWQTRRTGVARWMRERGVVWSDLKYDYAVSVSVDQPVLRFDR